MSFSVEDKVRESNRIEGILREPTAQECVEFARFLALPLLTISELQAFVHVYQADARLRDVMGRDVTVRHGLPPRGGPHIRRSLEELLEAINERRLSPWEAHLAYERLHPFTDGNGRSGRMLWYWQMREDPEADRGFLHAFYFQALQSAR